MSRLPPVLIFLLTAIFWTSPKLVFAEKVDPKAATIEVVVSGFRNQKGQIGASLFAAQEGFPDKTEKALRTFKSAIDGDTVTFRFENVPVGTYAIAVLHDENMNGKMDTNFFGFPKEGGGASNNPKPRRGPPRFDDAKFVLKEEHMKLEIKLQYP